MFPQEIYVTKLRPDIVIKSSKERILVLIELTSPSEENFEPRHIDKLERYEELAAGCRKLVGKSTYLLLRCEQVGMLLNHYSAVCEGWGCNGGE